MYRCDNCNKLQKFASKEDQLKAGNLKIKTELPINALKVVAETRYKKYETKLIKRIQGKDKETTIRSEGTEILRELYLCVECYNGLRPKDS